MDDRSEDQKGRPAFPVDQAPEELPINFVPFFDYLQSPQGHHIAGRVIDIVQDLKTAGIEKGIDNAKHERWVKLALIIALVAAVSLLSIFDKLDPTVAAFFGTVVGYFFGKGK